MTNIYAERWAVSKLIGPCPALLALLPPSLLTLYPGYGGLYEWNIGSPFCTYPFTLLHHSHPPPILKGINASTIRLNIRTQQHMPTVLKSCIWGWFDQKLCLSATFQTCICCSQPLSDGQEGLTAEYSLELLQAQGLLSYFIHPFHPEAIIVGHLCTYEGWQADMSKVSKIATWGPCKTLSEVRTFLGTAGLMQIFICNYSSIACLLT